MPCGACAKKKAEFIQQKNGRPAAMPPPIQQPVVFQPAQPMIQSPFIMNNFVVQPKPYILLKKINKTQQYIADQQAFQDNLRK